MIDLTGQQFGRLTVIKYVEKHRYLCRCDCGNEKTIYEYSLKNGDTKSCGCLRTEMTKCRSTLHGYSIKDKISYKIYRVWESMNQRCTNPSQISYPNYGGRGIGVCERWKNSFTNFLKDMGEPLEGLQIDRVDNDDDYCKENCRWVTRTEQCRNRRSNHMVTLNGETKCIAEWSETTGIKPCTIAMRLRRGWSSSKTLTTPVRTKSK